MPRVRRGVTGIQMVKFLQRRGFFVVRIRGSHHIMERVDLRTSVPVHNRPLKIGTLMSILRDVNMKGKDLRGL